MPASGRLVSPSNHATLAFGAAAAIALTVGRSRLTWSAMALATVVAVARVAQGVHYLHDIAFGALLGIAVLIIVVALSERLRESLRHRIASTPRMRSGTSRRTVGPLDRIIVLRGGRGDQP